MSSKTEDGEGEEARKDDAATTFTASSDEDNSTNASSREMATRDGVVQGRFIVGPGELSLRENIMNDRRCRNCRDDRKAVVLIAMVVKYLTIIF